VPLACRRLLPAQRTGCFTAPAAGAPPNPARWIGSCESINQSGTVGLVGACGSGLLLLLPLSLVVDVMLTASTAVSLP